MALNGPDPRRALRLTPEARLAITGAGGKSGLLFWLADRYRRAGKPVILSTTTHLAESQAGWADRHMICQSQDEIPPPAVLREPGSILITGPLDHAGKLTALDRKTLAAVHRAARSERLPFLIEADGSRQRALKAPGSHEPVVPDFVDTVACVAGLSGIGQPLDESSVHRSEVFARLAAASVGSTISAEMVAKVMRSDFGGRRGIPSGARAVGVLTQADSDTRRSLGARIARQLLGPYHAVLLGDLGGPADLAPRNRNDPSPRLIAVYEPVAAVILAAGGSSRFEGASKQTLLWRGEPLVRHVAKTALQAGLKPVIIVTGGDPMVAEAVSGLETQFVDNSDWHTGQASSVQAGLKGLPAGTGAAIFLLADQPQIPAALIRSIVSRYREQFSAVVAPLIDGERGNPVLFDRETFSELLNLTGDTGGRALFSKYKIDWVPWHDPRMLLDVDTADDFGRFNAEFP